MDCAGAADRPWITSTCATISLVSLPRISMTAKARSSFFRAPCRCARFLFEGCRDGHRSRSAARRPRIPEIAQRHEDGSASRGSQRPPSCRTPPPDTVALQFGAGVAAGLMIGIERGWRLRREKPAPASPACAPITLVGTGGALGRNSRASSSIHSSPLRSPSRRRAARRRLVRDSKRRDTTSAVAAVVALGLGLLAGAGQPALAVAGAAVVTLLLATRPVAPLRQRAQFDRRPGVRAICGDRRGGASVPSQPQSRPADAWNPFQLWLIVLLITGFSFAGYIASRTIGQRKGVLAAAVIGGAYSSTAVTASFSQRLGAGEEGPLTAS